MTKRKIDDIRARHAAACPGPWEFMHGHVFGRDGRMVADMDTDEAMKPGAIARARGYGEGNDRDLRNGECIAALHVDVATLLAEVDRLNERLRDVYAQACGGCFAVPATEDDD